MPRRAKFEPIKKPEGWQINVPSSMTPDGRRVRRFFETRDDARAFAEKLSIQYKNEGTAAFGLSADQRVTAARAFVLMEKAGLGDLLAVVREGISALKLKAVSKPLGEVFDKYIGSRERSEIYTSSLKRSRKRLGELAKIPISDVTPEIIEEHLLGLAASYRNALLREMRAVFKYGVKKGWGLTNPVDRIDFARLHVGEREVYSAKAAAALLGAAAVEHQDLLPFVAVGLFAGVRVYEMLRMAWENIDLKEGMIDLPAKITKRKRRRSIPIERALRRWLAFAAHRGAPKGGPLLPVGTADALREPRGALAGTAAVTWKQNALRHSYASYWLAEYKDIDRLALHLGHVGSLDVLHRFYHRVVTAKETKSFWALTPGKKNGEIVVRDHSQEGNPVIWPSSEACDGKQI